MAASLLQRLRGCILGRVRGQTLTLKGRLRSLSSAADRISDDPNKDDIYSLVSYVTRRVGELESHGSAPLPLLFGSEIYVKTHPLYRHYPEDTKLKILLMSANITQGLPQVDHVQSFQAKIFYQSMLNDDNQSYLNKDQIISRVLRVVQSHPKVGDCKVTEETRFYEDLGFGKWDFFEVIQALQMEFKLDIPDEIVSCKLAIEYIYDHRVERLSMEEFRKRIFLTGEYGESKSELCRIFVRDGEMKTNNIKSDSLDGKLHCETLSRHGIQLFKLFRNMQRDFMFDGY